MDKIGINTIQGCLATSRAAYLLYMQTGILGCNSVSAYLVQQTAEKLIKVQIPEKVFAKMSEKETLRFKTHNLKMLKRLFDKYKWPLIGNKFFEEYDAIVTSWETLGRYQEDFFVEHIMLDKAHKELVYWFDYVKRFYRLKVPKTEIDGKHFPNMNTLKEYMHVDEVLLGSIFLDLVKENEGVLDEERNYRNTKNINKKDE